MRLSPDQEEAEIAEATAEVLASEAPLERAIGRDFSAFEDERRLTKLAGELGWIGFGAPEDIGGGGAAAGVVGLLFYEFGRSLAPITLASNLLAARLSGDGDYLSGHKTAGFVVQRPGDRAWRLGAAGGDAAVQIDDRGLRLVGAPSGPPTVGLDPCVTLEDLAQGDLNLIVESHDRDLLNLARLLVAAQQLGVSARALELSVEYAKVREQFGRPIGSFQAIGHKCADMAVRSERARSQLYMAAAAMESGHEDVSFQIDAALQVCDDAANRNASDNIFIHGAIAVTAEHPAHLLLKRAMLLRAIGDPRGALRRLAEAESYSEIFA